ncbi:phage tail protein [Cronobacter sakazakii]|uniref:phage tail protein n=1 Tax=Cronobacter sakazakii TaxID=28141 RepID=UPI000CF0F1F7|nr:phage tail protein [Cronobacter sakazakii]ELY5802106.1 phage tail protein [Cronobacter sakazakii]PPY39048.1 phage tail protein [Cronobacter sakazakii]PPY51781.1 phage tail protein [Cronobacter sakazakii]PQX38277.1 phage tail protein [Cronobacter sakazakii]PQY10730.1 phage tail protein [Cronobacter sakazakii]
MADAPQKVIVKSSRIDASILPPNFPLPYKLYVIQQTTDMKDIADASNGANELAYEATVKNVEQDATLDDHENRISGLRSEVDDHESRITANTNSISSLSSRVTATEDDVSGLTTRVTTAEGNITSLQGDYVSKSATATQGLASPLNVTTSYSVNGTKVIGARQTGWTAATGTSLFGAFNASQTYSASTTYTQSEISALATGVVQARQRIKALEDALRAHGLIN